ncbi:uncharacterized protein LOC116255105 isoform X1 [Nymphaea colorata]|nr:uncharacterized protein LOC116255105 isoform X1 [Nymphaea colorata]XP_049934064.1 uncharacterized protein LOC116255105 isoform X1 [Nymphaea colorata]XP_049934065.1 uncharacterized protein LOC116255105 isoform X1 [Nymphaea colorata]
MNVGIALRFMEKLRRSSVHSNSPSETREAGSFGDCKSHIVDNVVLLRDWYLIKSPKAHMGKRLAVGGILSKGDQGVNNFESAPIIQRVNASRLRTADGLTILLFGLIDGRRTSENGFPNEALSFFQIGFPFTWEFLADGYISSDDTSCSSLGHANDVNELMHSAGRAKHVRIFSDAEKWSKSDSASWPENDRSMQSSFARKVEDKCGSFLKDPALQVGSNPKNLSPSDAWKSEDKGSVHKYNISLAGSALGNIRKLDDDGKIHPDDGDRCVKNYLDEATPNQTLSDTLKSISMSISYKNRGPQPEHECQHVNSGMEENSADKPSQMKGTGTISMGISYKNRDMQPDLDCQHINSDLEENAADKPSQMKHTGNSYFVSVSVDQPVETIPNTVIHPRSPEVGYAANTGCIGLSQPPECSNNMLNANIPVENLGGRESNVGKHPEIQKVSCSEIMYLTESGIVMPLATKFNRVPARLSCSPVVLAHKKFPCQPCKGNAENAKGGVFVGNSVGERIRDAAKLVIEGCTTRSNSKIVKDEHVESENDSLLRSPVKRTKTCQLGLSKQLPQRGALLKSETIKVTSKDASPVTPSTRRVTRARAKSTSFEGLEKEEQNGGSGLKDGYNKDATIPMECSKDAFLDMDGNTSGASEFGIGGNKDKMRLGAETNDSRHRSTTLRATSSSLRSSQKEGKRGRSTQQAANGEDVSTSISCSQDTVFNMDSRRSNSSEYEPGKNKNKVGLDAKNSDSGQRITRSRATSRSMRCSRKGGEGDCHIQKDTSNMDVTASKSCFKGALCERKSGETEMHVQYACRPFVPSGSAEKSSSAPGKALNLKMSSSGRLIVPPLAHWRNEQIVYDTEGGITCIFDGSQFIRRPAGTHSGQHANKKQKAA